MTLTELCRQIPNYAKDLRLNLEMVLTDAGAPGLDSRQIAMVALAAAIASRHAPLTAAIDADLAMRLDPLDRGAAQSAAAIMAMTNIYFRFTHLASNVEYQTLRAGLRMNVLAQHGGDKLGFELAALAASAIKGCGQCVDAHEKVLRQHGVSAQGVQSAVRIAAVIHAVAMTLEQQLAAVELDAAA